MELISVIVPVFNSAKYIDQCISSVLHQTYKYFELILVDDGSTDASGEICRKYAKDDKRVRYIHKTNAGVSSARNTGLEFAHGRYITFVDSDDCIHKEMLERLIKNRSADFSMCGYELYNEKKAVVTNRYVCKLLSGTTHDLANEIKDYLSPPFLLGPCGKLYVKDIINGNFLRFLPELSYGEDAVFVFEYLMHCKTIEIFDYVGYSYRKYGNETLSSKFLANKIDINYRINCLIDNFLRKEGIMDRKRIISERLLNCLISYSKELICSDFSYGEKKSLFYDKYSQYRNKLGEPRCIAQRIVIFAGEKQFCFALLYMFRLKVKLKLFFENLCLPH